MRALVTLGSKEGEKGEEGSRFEKLIVLLRMATQCQSLVGVAAEDVLRIGGLLIDNVHDVL